MVVVWCGVVGSTRVRSSRISLFVGLTQVQGAFLTLCALVGAPQRHEVHHGTEDSSQVHFEKADFSQVHFETFDWSIVHFETS